MRDHVVLPQANMCAATQQEQPPALQPHEGRAAANRATAAAGGGRAPLVEVASDDGVPEALHGARHFAALASHELVK